MARPTRQKVWLHFVVIIIMDFGLQSGTNLNTRGSSGREIETKTAKLPEQGYHCRIPVYPSAGPRVLSSRATYTRFLQATPEAGQSGPGNVNSQQQARCTSKWRIGEGVGWVLGLTVLGSFLWSPRSSCLHLDSPHPTPPHPQALDRPSYPRLPKAQPPPRPLRPLAVTIKT